MTTYPSLSTENVVFQQRFECAKCAWVLAFVPRENPMPRIRQHMEEVHGGMPKAREQ